MMRSLYAGISGLRNHQTRMDVIGNNIANVNTIGFKGSRVNFQDMLSQTMQGASAATGDRGGTNPVQIGMGMGVASIDTIFTDGSFQTTGKQNDLAISGQGFFVLSDGINQVYTRAGGFDFDTAGNLLVPGSGYKVMGYKADSNGVIGQTLESIQIPVGTSMAAKASSKVTYANNLMSSATAIGSPAEIAAAAANLATATAADTAADAAKAAAILASGLVPADTTDLANVAAAYKLLSSTAKASVDAKAALAYDSTNATFIANDAAATAALVGTDATDIATYDAVYSAISATSKAVIDTTAAVTSTAATLTAATAAVTAANDKSSDALASIKVYDSQGNAYTVSGTFEKTGDNTWSFTPAATVKDSAGAIVANVTSSAPIVIEFNADGSFKQSTTSATITIDQAGLTPPSPYAGAGAFSITPDFSTMTQYGGTTTVAATGQDGYASGSLEKTSINTSGVIVGQFSNGQILNLAQVALANFNNPSGLGKAGESLYIKTTNSGEPQVGAAGSGGRGSFNAGSLEMSNVDLAQQFSDMIVTQRGFQANSKIITTTDTMLEELVNLKR
ncbi:MAG: flagellar hook protein FlgE [Firmicutes bacterium]|nr:flagellar hook protein FlgE [Bacillota bacterium]